MNEAVFVWISMLQRLKTSGFLKILRNCNLLPSQVARRVPDVEAQKGVLWNSRSKENQQKLAGVKIDKRANGFKNSTSLYLSVDDVSYNDNFQRNS